MSVQHVPDRVLPSGTVTFCFTDIEGSTRLFHRFGERFWPLLEAHRRIVRTAVSRANGVEVRTDGDGFFLVFREADDAIDAAVGIQRALAAHPWPRGGRIRLRVGFHTGEAVVMDGDYVALAVNQAARVSASARGGQVVLSEATAGSVGLLPEGCHLVDRGPYFLEGFDDPVRLFELAYPDSETGSALNARPAVTSNLPTPRSAYVGRDDLLAQIGSRLARERLVTLTGMGGMGKTRTAVEVASRVRGDYPDGLWFADLSSIGDPGAVVGAVAEAVHAPPAEGTGLLEAVVRHLDGAHHLVVVDNCEHVIDEAARVVDELLDRLPDLTVLATSREALRIDGESVFQLEPLVVPSSLDDLDAVRDAEAVRLFMDRAARAFPSFLLDARNVREVAAIATRLDGLPIALEMAAARVGDAGASALLRRLDEPLSADRRGRLTHPRQQTLDATVRWSYDLLSHEEQRLFLALSVFTAPVSADDVDGVCPDAHLLPRLCDRSLVMASERDGNTTFRLLVPVRDLARRMLAEDPDLSVAIRERHLTWCAALGSRLSEDHVEDVRTAIEFGAGRPTRAADTGELANMAVSRLRRWGREREAVSLAEDVMSRPEFLPDELRASLHHNVGAAAWEAGLFEVARRHSLEGLAIAERAGSHELQGRCLNNLGAVARSEGDMEAARANFERALALVRTAGVKEPEVASLSHLGMVARAVGDFATAMFRFGEALRLAAEEDIVPWQISCLFLIADAAWAGGDYEVARTRALQGLDLARDTGEAGYRREHTFLLNLAATAWATGSSEEAKSHLDDALPLVRDLPDRRPLTQLHVTRSMVARRAGDLQAAARDLASALDTVVGHDLGEVLLQAALVAISSGHTEAGRRVVATLRRSGSFERLTVDVPIREDVARVLAAIPPDASIDPPPYASDDHASSVATELMSSIAGEREDGSRSSRRVHS